jgi:HK97 gp10 family phage protein
MAEPETIVVGLDQWLKDLERLPLLVRKKLLTRALRQAAEPIEERMTELAPDDPTTPGGRIAENIKTNVLDAVADSAAAYIGPTGRAFFARFAEIGTAHQTATPFMGPAFTERVDEAVRIMGDILGAEIEKALRGTGTP